jgi:hypothetical protein
MYVSRASSAALRIAPWMSFVFVNHAQEPVAAEHVEADAILRIDLLQEPRQVPAGVHPHAVGRIQLVEENDRDIADIGNVIGELSHRSRWRRRGGRRGARLDREHLHLLRLAIVEDLKVV